jgi:hypothetical protein
MGFPNLGIALGAGVDEMNRQRASDRADRSLQMQEESHQAQMNLTKRQNEEYDAAKRVFADALPVFQGGWQKAAEHLADRYNANDSGIEGYNDGNSVKVQVQPNGVYVTQMNRDGSGGATTFYTPQDVMREHVRATYGRLSAINPQYGNQLIGWLDKQSQEETRKAERGDDIAHRDKRESVSDQQWNQNFGLRKQEVGMSGARLGLAQSEFDANRADKKELKTKEKERADSAVSIYAQQHPGASEAELAAVRSGVLPALPKDVNNEYTTTTDSMGLNITRTNKNTGAVDVIDPKTGGIRASIAAPSRPGIKPAQPEGAIPPVDQRVVGKTEINHPTKGRLVWSEEGGQKGWKAVGK